MMIDEIHGNCGKLLGRSGNCGQRRSHKVCHNAVIITEYRQMVRNPDPQDIGGPVQTEGNHVIAGKDSHGVVRLLKHLKNPARGVLHVLRIDVKQQMVRAACESMRIQCFHHAFITFLIGVVVKALKNAADLFMTQLNHVINRLKGGFFVVQPQTVIRIVFKAAVHVHIGNPEFGELFDVFMLTRDSKDNDPGNIHPRQIFNDLLFFFEVVSSVA